MIIDLLEREIARENANVTETTVGVVQIDVLETQAEFTQFLLSIYQTMSSMLFFWSNKNIFLSNLFFKFRADDIRRVFSEFGQITDIGMPRDYYSGRLKGYAFVEYPLQRPF